MTKSAVVPIKRSVKICVGNPNVSTYWCLLSIGEEYAAQVNSFNTEPDIPDEIFYDVIQFVSMVNTARDQMEPEKEGIAFLASHCKFSKTSIRRWLRRQDAPSLEWTGMKRFIASMLLQHIEAQTSGLGLD